VCVHVYVCVCVCVCVRGGDDVMCSYAPKNVEINGLNGCFGVINHKQFKTDKNSIKMNFSFVETASYKKFCFLGTTSLFSIWIRVTGALLNKSRSMTGSSQSTRPPTASSYRRELCQQGTNMT
jgi:hypothetical protein